MEPVAADDLAAVDPVVLAVPGVRHGGAGGGDVVQFDVADLELDPEAGGVGGPVQILLDVRLPVRHETGVGVLLDVDEEQLVAAVGDAGTAVDVALRVHPGAETGRAQQLDRAPLEDAGTNA